MSSPNLSLTFISTE